MRTNAFRRWSRSDRFPHPMNAGTDAMLDAAATAPTSATEPPRMRVKSGISGDVAPPAIPFGRYAENHFWPLLEGRPIPSRGTAHVRDGYERLSRAYIVSES